MAFDKSSLKDYVEVKDRILEFYEKHPTGSIMSEVVTLTDKLVVVKATVYRNSEDKYPCTGHSQLEIPGGTPYTRGSEVENAETSAWGRALAAMGFKVKNGIASQSEIQNKSWAQNAPAAKPANTASQTQDPPKQYQTAPAQTQGDKPSLPPEFYSLTGVFKKLRPGWGVKNADMTPADKAARNAWMTSILGREVVGYTGMTVDNYILLRTAAEDASQPAYNLLGPPDPFEDD